MRIIGIDLAGLETNETGFCVLDVVSKEDGEKDKVQVKRLLTDREILNEIDEKNSKKKVDVIAIDAPFDFPKSGLYRPGELKLLKRGFKPLSPLFPGMKPLTRRAKMLVRILRDHGYNVIEVFANASEKIFGLNRGKAANKDEYDAMICALTGKYYLKGRYENVDGIIIPK
ncbi:MAG: DUF429 domain-containing protein [Candidatus Aenigmarchaeota archaeon]|nr:DUF429 domain-containing protein [Candidatus Aenigmarchaeota archaeon]